MREAEAKDARQAFSGVLKMDPHSDKKPEILFRLGTIYKQVDIRLHSLSTVDSKQRCQPQIAFHVCACPRHSHSQLPTIFPHARAAPLYSQPPLSPSFRDNSGLYLL